MISWTLKMLRLQDRLNKRAPSLRFVDKLIEMAKINNGEL